jgi:hypothetical protein
VPRDSVSLHPIFLQLVCCCTLVRLPSISCVTVEPRNVAPACNAFILECTFTLHVKPCRFLPAFHLAASTPLLLLKLTLQFHCNCRPRHLTLLQDMGTITPAVDQKANLPNVAPSIYSFMSSSIFASVVHVHGSHGKCLSTLRLELETSDWHTTACLETAITIKQHPDATSAPATKR